MDVWKLRFETFFHYTDLIKELVSKDLKLKYRRSFLGYLWSILNPLLIMIVMTAVFATIQHKNVMTFAPYLLIGRTLFEFTTVSTNQAMQSIRGNQSLIKKVYIPKYVFPFAKCTSATVDCVFSLGALLLVMLVCQTPLSPFMLLFPFVLIQLYIFCLGLGFFLSALIVFFRDIEYIYKAITTAWMYLTPIFYSMTTFTQSSDPTARMIGQVIKHCNPLYCYVTQFRVLFLGNEYLVAANEKGVEIMGEMPSLLFIGVGWAWAVGMFAFGLFIFKKTQDKFILYI